MRGGREGGGGGEVGGGWEEEGRRGDGGEDEEGGRRSREGYSHESWSLSMGRVSPCYSIGRRHVFSPAPTVLETKDSPRGRVRSPGIVVGKSGRELLLVRRRPSELRQVGSVRELRLVPPPLLGRRLVQGKLLRRRRRLVLPLSPPRQLRQQVHRLVQQVRRLVRRLVRRRRLVQQELRLVRRRRLVLCPPVPRCCPSVPSRHHHRERTKEVLRQLVPL